MITYRRLLRRSIRSFDRTDDFECRRALGPMRRRAARSRRDRKPASLLGAVAVMMAGVGIGATPASAAEVYGAPLPNYDPGVHGTIRHDLANCGIVMYEGINYQGKKLCAPALGDNVLSSLFSLRLNQAANWGGDMDWQDKVSSIQVRPGFRLELYRLGSITTQRSYSADTPDLGDFNDRANHVRVAAYLTVGEGNNNAADGQPVTTKNAVSCNSSQGPEKAVDNSVASIYVNKWCGSATALLTPWLTPPTLQVDLGADRFISGVVVHHAGDGPLSPLLNLLGPVKVQRESDLFNTKAYNIKVSSSPTGPWTVAGTFANTWSADVSNHPLVRSDNRLYRARYVQLEVTLPSSLDWVARIQELEVLTLNR